ncbi:MAG TPA: hypothetical protein VL022_00785 [Moheibacter sp.]|nr:hypothetical protein [Moheibacter sp.]
MTKREGYQLKFERFVDSGNVHYWCEHLGNSEEYKLYASFLRHIDFELCSHIIQEIENAQNGQYFEQYQGPDSLVDEETIEITPPNIVLSNGQWTVLMSDFKELLEEWRSHLSN